MQAGRLHLLALGERLRQVGLQLGARARCEVGLRQHSIVLRLHLLCIRLRGR